MISAVGRDAVVLLLVVLWGFLIREVVRSVHLWWRTRRRPQGRTLDFTNVTQLASRRRR